MDPQNYRLPPPIIQQFIDEEVIKDSGFKRSEIEVNWHGHQDRGLGVANNIAAVEAGADVIHGTALGVGERAGENVGISKQETV